MSEKISQMTNGNPALNSDIVPVVRSGANYQVTLASVAALASGPSFGGGDSAFFFGPGITDLGTIIDSTVDVVSACEINGSFVTQGQVILWLFQLTETFEISKCSQQANDNAAGHTSAFGIYDFAGNLVVNGGSFNSLTTPLVQTNSFTPVTLQPGTYWLAAACTLTATSAGFQGLQVTNAGAIFANFMQQNATRFALASNLATAGPNNPQGNPTCVLPATLGTLTPWTPNHSAPDGVMMPLWE